MTQLNFLAQSQYPTWTKQFYGATWQAEKPRLQQAALLDRDAALKSAS